MPNPQVDEQFAERERDKALKEATVDLEESLRQLCILRSIITTKGQEKIVDEIDRLMNRALYQVDRIYSDDYLYEPRVSDEGTLDMFDPLTRVEELDFSNKRTADNYLIYDDNGDDGE